MLIIFDLDDTLIDTSGCITPIQLENALTRLIQEGADIPNPKEALQMLRRLNATSQSARHAIEEFLEINGIDKSFFELAVKEVYETISPDIPIFTLDQAIEVLSELSLSHRLAVVTIGKREQQLHKMKKAGIDSTIFSKIIVTEERNKKNYYQSIVEEFSISPSEVVVCGDRIAIDLSPAKQLGFRTVHMRWGRGLHSVGAKNDVDFAISHLSEIKEILAKMASISSF